MKNIILELVNKCIELKFIDLIWLLIIPIINVNYFLASVVSDNGISLTTSLDRKIPFNAFFILPYIYWYVFVVLGFILIMRKDRERYIRCLIATTIGMCVSYVFFYVFPTEISRPVVNDSNILNKLVNMIYYNDRPVNCFPSLHVLNTYLIMRYTKIDDSKRIFSYTQIVGILIILSTVFIKQHFVYDILGSIIISEIIISIVNRIKDEKVRFLLELPYEVIEKIASINMKNDKNGRKAIIGDKKQGMI